MTVAHSSPIGSGVCGNCGRRVAQRRKAIQVIKRPLNELIASLRSPRRRSDHKATAENINRHITAGTDQSPFARVAIPGLIVSAAATRDNWRPAMSLDRVGQYSLVCRIDIEHRHAAALAAHEADSRRVRELARDLGAAD